MFRQFCHHQGVTYCLAKITIYIIFRAMQSLCYGYVATCQWKECLLESLVSYVVFFNVLKNCALVGIIKQLLYRART